LIAPDYFDPSLQVQGREGIKQLMTIIFKAVPDIHQVIEDIIAEGDKVWVRLKITGTHKGELSISLPSIGRMTLPPTGKKITYTTVQMWHIVDGKVTESWGVYDMLDSYKQLGLIEHTEKAKKLFPKDVS